MERRESFTVNRSFPATCQYIQNAFFPRLKEAGVGAIVQLLPPRITVNEPARFAMKRMIEKRVFLTVEAAQDQAGTVHITVMSSFLATFQFATGLIFTALTCGLLALLLVPLFYLKYNRWKLNIDKTLALLKTDLA